jgi:hypothetical protein
LTPPGPRYDPATVEAIAEISGLTNCFDAAITVSCVCIPV